MELFETDFGDVEFHHDYQAFFERLGSKGGTYEGIGKGHVKR